MSETTRVRFFFCGDAKTFPLYRTKEDYHHLLTQSGQIKAPVVAWNKEIGIPCGYGFCAMNNALLPKIDDPAQTGTVHLISGDVVQLEPPRSGVVEVGGFRLYVDGVGLY